MDYKALYQDIMKIDQKIRFATILDMNGKILQTGQREGIRNLLSREESKRSLEQAVNVWKMRNELAPKIGKGQYVLAVYEKIKRITMPLDDNHLIYVTTDVGADHAKIIDGLQRLKKTLTVSPKEIMFRKVGAVILMVSDMERSMDFYKNTLGLKLKSQSGDWIEFIKDGTVLALHPAKKKFKSGAKPKIGMLVGFIASDLDKVCRDLNGKGVRFFKEPTKEEFGKHAIILDPDGYMISMIEFVMRPEEWEQAPGYYGFAPM